VHCRFSWAIKGDGIGKQLILVDTGTGQCIGATAGMLSDNIKVASYQIEQIDTMLLTHLHLDHVCGLVDGQQKTIFANATVYTAKAEADYWLDPRAHAGQRTCRFRASAMPSQRASIFNGCLQNTIPKSKRPKYR